MELGLAGKTVLVTGGSKGIGRATAHVMAAEGARVLICSRNQAALDETVSSIRKDTSKNVDAISADLSTLEGVQWTAAEAVRRLRRLDILVNNAGAIKGGDFLTMPDEEWTSGWSLKLLGYIRMARAVFPRMREQGGGRIVNVVGMAARNPAPTYMTAGPPMPPSSTSPRRSPTSARLRTSWSPPSHRARSRRSAGTTCSVSRPRQPDKTYRAI
jgi:NAD(P)-dependent dehydrogenase (short-subunit alcohol dehydrogenase family)